MPAWVLEDILALHRYASSLGGEAVHAMVELARGGGEENFGDEVCDAVGALLSGEALAFASCCSAARALAGWIVGGVICRSVLYAHILKGYGIC